MRFLFVVQGQDEQDQIGYTSAARQLLAEGVLEDLSFFFPLRDYGQSNSWEDTWATLIQLAKSTQPTCIFFQFFTYPAAKTDLLIKSLKSLSSKPLILTSYGDPFSWSLFAPHPATSYMKLARFADVNFVKALGNCAKYLQFYGVNKMLFCPDGFCQKRFSPSAFELTTSRSFDISFVGSRNISKNPLSTLFYTGRRRHRLVSLLQKEFGARFALFGRGWDGFPSWQGAVAYEDQVNAIRKSMLYFGGYPASRQFLYHSDRIFAALISGVPFIDWDVPGLSWMLQDGEDWYPVSTPSQMINQIKSLLSQDQKPLQEKAHLAALRAASRHSQYHRMRFMVRTASLRWIARNTRKTAPLPPFDFFLPEVDLQKILPQILVGW
jgi:hypothetical protein